ncbi:outer membrane protein transport protein [Acinetobacter sp. I-MWF]|uniref:OmpP1/FadL family transporter n=1 Tax=Acinetobacter sp. I-MWF TaxID=2940517 RepID=UPI0021CA0837|nr:outer membrane protein transport protein [Acinetobacter sp. I-MWF]MCT9980882.1 outer membrane protein transport protein [Acinetobacter sp. I-MWF]
MLSKINFILLFGCMPLYAQAFNGVYLTGSGQVSSGMGGISLAQGMDRTSIHDNPANLSYQNNGVDAQISLLNIRSRATFLNQAEEFKSDKLISIPSLAIIKHFDDRLSFGLSLTGAGAAVDYDKPAINGFPTDKAKDNLAIVKASPTVSYKVLPNLSIGANLDIGVEQFRAKGVLAGMDTQGTPMFLDSHGNHWAYGIGGSLGVTWEFQPNWWLGASYISEMRFSKLKEYKDDLLASSQGRINLPERYGFGINHKFNSQVTLAADLLRINWQDADGLGEKGSFNWQNQNVYRIGLDYKFSPKDHIRFGFSHADVVVDSQDTLVNFYANAIANNAWTIGYGRDFGFATLNLAYEYAVNKKIIGSDNSSGTNLSNQNHVFSLGFSKDF